MFARICLAATLLVSTPIPQNLSEPKLSPFFSETAGFGFALECPNEGPKAGPPMIDVRLDGIVWPRSGSGGSVGGPLPGQPWKALVTFHKVAQKSGSGLGFNMHRMAVADLTPGKHTISLSCGPVWPADIAFYVDRFEEIRK